jgi:acyl-CoA thioester hydrolase
MRDMPGASLTDAASEAVQTRLTVRFCETDLMGIVHHSNYLQYFEVGRVAWLKAQGVAYEQWAARGTHLPVVDVHLRYRRPARFDDELTISTRISGLTRASVRFAYQVLRGDELLCEGETLLACVGPGLSACRFPPEVWAVLSRFRAPAPSA